MLTALAGLGHKQQVIHTGQHYDERLSGVFFTQLGLPKPDVDLRVGSGTHGGQTRRGADRLEQEFVKRSPALIMVYGDVNSTLAGRSPREARDPCGARGGRAAEFR